MDGGFKKSSAENNKRGGRSRWSKLICWGWVIFSALFVVGLVILVLGFTVFKTKRPTTAVNSVSLKHFHLSIDVLSFRVLLNVSLDAAITVRNPNRVAAFQFDNSSALLVYRGRVVGEVPLPGGKLGARQSVPMNITLTLMADRGIQEALIVYHCMLENGDNGVALRSRKDSDLDLYLYR